MARPAVLLLCSGLGPKVCDRAVEQTLVVDMAELVASVEAKDDGRANRERWHWQATDLSDWVDESVNRRPIRRLASKTVLRGFIAAWFFAASPIMRSVSVKATNDGVVRLPWSLAMISTRPFLYTPTQEYVVPRSIPTVVSTAHGQT